MANRRYIIEESRDGEKTWKPREVGFGSDHYPSREFAESQLASMQFKLSIPRRVRPYVPEDEALRPVTHAEIRQHYGHAYGKDKMLEIIGICETILAARRKP